MKFLRNYEIRIKTPGKIISSNPNGTYNYDKSGQLITIAPPVSVQFDIERAVMATQNNASVTLYNLAPSTQNKIYKDKFMFTQYWQMFILAGYGEKDLYEVFRGNIVEAFSYKQGTEWITKIEANDGAFAIQNGFVNETVTKDINLKDMILRVVHTMPETLAGIMGSPTNAKQPSRGQTLIGPSFDVAQSLVGGKGYIDGETYNVLADDEIIADGNIPVLDSDNLFESPKRRDTYLEVTTLLMPEIRINYAVELRSKITRYNGQYKVLGIKHSATISQESAGDASSMISLFAGSAPFLEVKAGNTSRRSLD